MSLPLTPGLIGGLLGDLFGGPVKAVAKIGLDAVSGWIVAGTQQMLADVVQAISLVSTPSLTASWFSSSYWRIAGLGMLLTVPFLFAAAVQAVLRGDIGVLLRAAFVDLPVAVLAVTLTAPLVALLLAATDEMCAVVTGGGAAGRSFLTAASSNLSVLHSGFALAVIALMMLVAGLALLVELVMRSAAIYIVVLFLPLGFAAMVWPARRVWVKRMVELLVALILSKFAMVAVLSLAVTGLASFGADQASLTTAVTAMALMVLAAFSPWALLRLLPFTEIAAGHGTMLGQEARDGARRIKSGDNPAARALDPVAAGFNALDHLVRGSAASAAGAEDGGGLTDLRRGGGSHGARSSRNRMSELGVGDGGGSVSNPSDPATTADDTGGASVGSGGPQTNTDLGGAAASAGLVAGLAAPGGGNAEPTPGGSTPIGHSGTAGRGGTAPDPGPNPAETPVRPPIEDVVPVLHPDNAAMEVSLRGDGGDFLVPADEGRRSAQEPPDDVGGPVTGTGG